VKAISNCEAFVNVRIGLGMNTVAVGIGVGVGGMCVGVGGKGVCVGDVGIVVVAGTGLAVWSIRVGEGVAVIARCTGSGVSVGSRSGAITLVSVAHRQQLNNPGTRIAAAMSAFPKQD